MDEEFAKKLTEGEVIGVVGAVAAGSSATLRVVSSNNVIQKGKRILSKR